MARTYRDHPTVKAQRRRRTCGDCGSNTCDWCLSNRTIQAQRVSLQAVVTDDGPEPEDVLAVQAPWADSRLRAEADAYEAAEWADWDDRYDRYDDVYGWDDTWVSPEALKAQQEALLWAVHDADALVG